MAIGRRSDGATAVPTGNPRFDPRNPDTWGKGGKAPLLAFDCSFGSTHGLVFAGSGGYKTSSVVVPTCLRWRGPIVCLDPTGEVGDMVYRVRSTSRRKVRILDPRRPKVGFNVLDWIGTGDRSGHVQSLILGAVLALVAVQMLALGIVGDALAGQRVMVQRVYERVRRLELEAGVEPSHLDPDSGAGDSRRPALLRGRFRP